MNRLFIVAAMLLLMSSTAVAMDRYTPFDITLNELRKKHKIPGMSVAVVKNGRIDWSKGYGYRDSNNEVDVTEDTPFWIASVTKTFVGLTFLHLEKNGLVNLDELASDTPEFMELCGWLASTTIPFAKGLDCQAPITIRHILHHQVNKPVGTQYLYNPIMYSRLSRYLEHKFGQGVRAVEGRHNYLGQSIDRYILNPAGMSRTMASMWDSHKPDVYFDMADGFAIDSNGRKTRLKRPQRHIAGGAGMISTVIDLAKYEIAMSNGTIVPDDISKTLFTAANFKDGSTSPYGFGWHFQQYQGETLMWHGGWDEENGYSAIYLRMPERNLAFIVLANSEGLWWGNALDRSEIEKSEFVQAFLGFIDN